jgi:hypothetical protein
MRGLVALLLVAVALAGCFEVIELSPPPPDAGYWEDAAGLGDAQWIGDAGLPDAGL